MKPLQISLILKITKSVNINKKFDKCHGSTFLITIPIGKSNSSRGTKGLACDISPLAHVYQGLDSKATFPISATIKQRKEKSQTRKNEKTPSRDSHFAANAIFVAFFIGEMSVHY